MPPEITGFSIIRNASLLDFPLEASVQSVLPGVDSFVLAVGRSDDDTLERARQLAHDNPRITLLQTEWDFSLGSRVLSQQTDLAMAAAPGDWGIYIQADEVLADGGAEELRQLIAMVHDRPEVEGVTVDYTHFYGGFDSIAVSRRWYRREIRALRLGVSLHSYGDAQGFRAGDSQRRVRCVRSRVRMYHYGWARPEWALLAKRDEDRMIFPNRIRSDPNRPLLPWMPGIQRFRGQHPAPVRSWVQQRSEQHGWVAAPRYRSSDLKVWLSTGIEKLTGWRPFEFRNYTLVK